MISKTMGALVMLSLLTGTLIAGCDPPVTQVEPSSLTGMRPCDVEDGSGDVQVYPCVWDARVRGNRTWGEDYPPVLVYVRGTDAGCPVLPDIARCFDVDEWLS